LLFFPFWFLLLLLEAATVWDLGFSATGSGFASSCFLFFLDFLLTLAFSVAACLTGDSRTLVTTVSIFGCSITLVAGALVSV